MRSALARSLEVRQVTSVRYERGSIVICTSCARPLYRLERGIEAGEKAGRACTAFAPVTAHDLAALLDRDDVAVGVRALLKAEPSLPHYADRIPAPRTGHPALCPFCDQVFVQGRTTEVSDTIDRAYVWELVVIPPRQAPGRFTRNVNDLWRIV